MFGNIDFLTQTSAMARHAQKRHETIAENLAHADTPDYKARDLPSFDFEAVQRAFEGHDVDLRRMMSPVPIEDAQASPNGNTVSVEDQLGRAADAQAQHQTALAVYRKAIDLLRISYATPR